MLYILKNLRKRDYITILFIIILIILQVFLDLRIPEYMSTITKLVESSSPKTLDIVFEGLKMLSCALGSLLAAVIVCYNTSLLSATFTKNTRASLFNKVQSFSMNEMKKFKVSSLITRTTNDITNVQMFIAMGLQMLIKAPITAIWAINKIVNVSVEWTLITALAIFLLLVLIIIIMIFVDSLNEVTRENLNGIRVIRAFNAYSYHKNKFNKYNDEITDTHIYIGKLMGLTNPFMYLIMNLLTLGIYFVGAYMISSASMIDRIDIFSNMVVNSSYAIQVVMSFIMLAVIFIMYPRTQVSLVRINEVLKTDSSINDGKINNIKDKGSIIFDNVSFKYNDSEEDVLSNISFEVNKGDVVAFIGSCGSGKSTLVNLIPRFYDVTKGNVLVDGVNVKDYKLEDLHKKIGYISQKPYIFNDTIRNNISYGNKRVKNNDLIDAVNISEAYDFVNDMGLDAIISSSGNNLSGGQKQRVSIARAIAKKPEILIFDDSFSALDYKTDYKLRNNIKTKLKDTTILIVAQRIGTIMNADKIVVLDNGKCVGMGTHQELLKKCKTYLEIAKSQISKEELDYGKAKKK